MLSVDSASPRAALSKLRRNKGRTSPSGRAVSSQAADGEESSDGSLRPSTDGSRSERLRSADSRGGGEERSGRRLTTLLQLRKRSPKKRSAASPEPRVSFADDQARKASLIDDGDDGDDDGHDSLLTDDGSDDERRPSVSRHQSHTGLLTLSSPEINPRPAVGYESPNLVAPTATAAAGVPQIVEPAAPEAPSAVGSQPPTGQGGGDSESIQSVDGPDGSVLWRPKRRAPSVPQGKKPLEPSDEERPSTPNKPSTPTTLVTPPTPTDPGARFPIPSQSDSPLLSNRRNSVDSIRQRRAQSANLPTRFPNYAPAALPTTVEEAKTPGGTLTQPTAATGFFSSIFTAAQKAADQLSNTIGPVDQPRRQLSASGELAATRDIAQVDAGNRPEKQATVETLGQGDLSLSHLGISEGQDAGSMATTLDVSQQRTTPEKRKAAEEAAAARAVSAAYEKPLPLGSGQMRPLVHASTERLTSEQSPPREMDGPKRTNSVRSRLSGRRRKHRGSSTTTNTTLNALAPSAASLLHSTTTGLSRRLTGFAVASNKRNKEYHQLFRSVPEDDYLIEDYSAALQRDILLHGRLYISEAHICFSSNILGWVTHLVISFDEVVSIEKKNTAVIFPNAIVIQTLQGRNTFASFVARDSTYELLIGIWKISHPNLRSSSNGVALVNSGTGDKTELMPPEDEEEEDLPSDGSDDEVYDEDDEGTASINEPGMTPSVAGSDHGEAMLNRKTSGAPVGALPLTNGSVAVRAVEVANVVSAGTPSYPGPQTHVPTECSDSAEHYERPLTDTIIPAPLGQVYSMMFGPSSNTFMRKWLVDDQKSRELNWPDNVLDQDHKTMVFDYIKPLNAPVGPKQTKCITTNTLIAFDLEKAVSVDCSTATPDVPSGNVFTTKTKYCLMWGPDNSTRMVANCVIEWTGKSWLKGPIEKGAFDGQTDYAKSLVAALRLALAANTVSRRPKKGKRRGTTRTVDGGASTTTSAPVAISQPPKWGLLEPLHQVLEPILALVRPLISSPVVIAVLLAWLVYPWVFSQRGRGEMGLGSYPSPERLYAYEQIWRKEESELWRWLEDRAGLDRLQLPEDVQDRRRRLQMRDMGQKLQHEQMQARQMVDAIRVTEERLEVLKDAVRRKKETLS
ncbi:hypothetical protein K470DRAFT_262957 [Piedraia hortae CBS 480.64]|uniref:VASt domain-containing protein n=1 Tax=Piedraia hortae CBS 480.64 TaxID=1314780 RepID=A0A6A7C5C0_9PEZI|nr:hypothetical protein K470DRAFT_262957 [Piedraia hortae CBS 480.64]